MKYPNHTSYDCLACTSDLTNPFLTCLVVLFFSTVYIKTFPWLHGGKTGMVVTRLLPSPTTSLQSLTPNGGLWEEYPKLPPFMDEYPESFKTNLSK